METFPVPMLAESTTSAGTPSSVVSSLVASRDEWWFEIKFDGIRALVERDAAGNVRISSRRQLSITHRYPDVVDALAAIDFVGVLDGEIIVTDDRGRPSFALAHKRDAQSTPSKIRRLAVQLPATFVPFDVLTRGERDLRTLTYLDRRAELAELWTEGGGAAGQLSLASTDGEAMWRFVTENNLEGLVAKSAGSRYVPRRSKSWRKLKATRTASVVALAVSGDRDAVEMGVYDGEVLRPVGRVGSGFSMREWGAISKRLAAGTPTVMEVEFLEVSSQGQLRFPVFHRIIDGVDPLACTAAGLVS